MKLLLKGKLTIKNALTGAVLYEKYNIITDNGLALVADRLEGNGVPALSHFAIGTSTTPVAITDTTLGAEAFRKAFDSTSSPASVFQAACLVDTTEALFVWKEFGILNAASGGVLFSHLSIDYDHPTQAVNVILTYEVTIARA
jgi:hypothetical protein